MSSEAPAAGAAAAARPPPLLDAARRIDYGLDFARLFDLPRGDGLPREKASLNQYYYSPHTAARLAAEVARACPAPARVAYVCTPSLFVARRDAGARPGDALLEIDEEAYAARSGAGFVRFDLAAPEALPAGLRGAFAMAVLDPPLISAAAWQLAARAVDFLLDPAGPRRLLATTVAGNAPLLARLFPGMAPVAFLPEIPHLVHSFRAFTNYESESLGEENEELPGDGRELPDDDDAAAT